MDLSQQQQQHQQHHFGYGTILPPPPMPPYAVRVRVWRCTAVGAGGKPFPTLTTMSAKPTFRYDISDK